MKLPLNIGKNYIFGADRGLASLRLLFSQVAEKRSWPTPV